jgi:hypothetical protein
VKEREEERRWYEQEEEREARRDVNQVAESWFGNDSSDSSHIAQVGKLLETCSQFEKQKMVEKSEKVRKLLGSYRALKGRSGEDAGVRGHYTTLQKCWDTFQKNVEKLTSNLELSKKFHEVLYEVSVEEGGGEGGKEKGEMEGGGKEEGKVEGRRGRSEEGGEE